MTADNNTQQETPRQHAIRHRYLRIAAWSAAGLALTLVVCCVAVILFVNSETGHRYLLALAQRKGADALGVPVEVENYTLHPYALSADLYGVRIAGAAPHDELPLLQVDHLKVGIRVVSLVSRTWYFNQIEIDHPVAWVVVDKNGISNLPVFKSSGTNQTNVFDLGIRHIQVQRGEVYYNSRPSALAADLHDVAFNSIFNSLLRQYSGRLAYSNGSLTVGSLRPLQHNLECEFDATPSLFTLKHGNVTAGPSSVSLNATIENYANPEVKAEYQIVLDGKQAAQILNEPSVPSGSVQTSGSLQFQQIANRSAVESLSISGSLSSRKLDLKNPSVRANLSNLSANYSLMKGNVSLSNLRAQIMGGYLTGEGSMQAIGGNSHSTVQLKLQKVSLAELERSIGKPSSPNAVSINGAANATATATWGKTINDLVAHADVTLDGLAKRAHTNRANPQPSSAANVAAPPTLPVQGTFHADYTNADQSLALKHSFIKSSQLNVSLNGTISRQSSLSVSLQANDLNEVSTLVDIVRNSEPNAATTDLKGQASFQGGVRGSITSPDISGQLTGSNLEYNGASCKLLTTQIDLSNARASLQNLHMEGIDQNGNVIGTASIALSNWSITRNSAAQVDLTASGLQMATVSQLVGSSLPVTGTINANAHLHGAVIAPTGNANIRLTSAAAFGEPVSQARIDLTGSGNQVQATASVQLAAGSIQAQVTTDLQARTYKGQVTSSGIDLAKLATIKTRGIDAKGVVRMHASGQGSYDDPGLDADIEIPTLTMGEQTISNTQLQINAANHIANVVLASAVAGTEIRGKARVNLQGDYDMDGSLDMPSMSIQPILAALEPDEDLNLTGQAELHATFHGPFKNKNQIQAQVKIPLLKVAYGNSIEVAASPIEADYEQGSVRLQPVDFRGTDTDLNIQGDFPIGSTAPASLQAHGTIDLKLATIFDPDLRASGQLRVDINSHGTTADSLLAGEIDLADATVATTTSPVSLQHANGALQLRGNRLTISKFQGTVGGGSLVAQGAVTFRPALQLNLGAAIKDAQVLYPDGVRETVDATLRLTGNAKNATLGGAVTLSNLSFTPAFDLNSVVNQLSGGVEVPNTGGFEQNLQLNIAVNSTSNTSLASRTLSVDGQANLQVRGTVAEPVLLGRVSLASGDVILNGNRFVLTGGTIQFINPSMTEPVLNISLTTNIKEYKIDLRFRGPASQLRTQYTATPSLPPADIINLLAFGQTTEASAMNSTPMDQQAEGLVASQVANQVTSRISKAAGISQLSISPVLAGGTTAGPPGANLTIQQRVTGNLFVTFSTNVATTQGQTIQGQYRVSPRVTVSATRDPNGGFAVDTLIKKSW